MAVPKNTQTRFVGITYHIHYTSLCLLFEQPCTHVILYMGHMVHACRNGKLILQLYPGININISDTYMLNQICMRKASVWMYYNSGYDTLSLQILFVYFLALPSLLHPSILFNYFLYLLLIIIRVSCNVHNLYLTEHTSGKTELLRAVECG